MVNKIVKKSKENKGKVQAKKKEYSRGKYLLQSRKILKNKNSPIYYNAVST